ncbi:MAG: DNA-3-methyladenine glycosylase [Clostridia bacterium]|nr:DNA-3-methyladenine glycosylase [Clostridia bacterium]
MKKINNKDFFTTDTVALARNLIGKWICSCVDGNIIRAQISETEAYLGVEDSACHTYKGKRTARVEPMWREGGTIYVYLCYGLHYLLNIVSKKEGEPEAVLIRALKGAEGPARATKLLGVDKSLNGQSILDNGRIWIEDDGLEYDFIQEKRVGINYALEKDREALLRFVLKD